MNKKELLQKVILASELKFARGSCITWKNADFVDLSRAVFLDTEVSISPNTLKRVFGKITVDDDYVPQQATIDALAQYAQCNLDTTNAVEPIFDTDELNCPKIELAPSKALPTKISIARLIFFLLIAVIFASIFFWVSNKKTVATIALNHSEGSLPVTAFFNINYTRSKDSVFVNFGDKSPLVFLKNNTTKVGHNYLFPGVFDVCVQTKKDTITSTKFYVASNKWLALGFHKQKDLPEHYYEFLAEKNGKDSSFYISKSQLMQKGIDTVSSFYTRLCNFTPTDSIADNFIFEARFKNETHEKGIYCYGTQFQINGLQNKIKFKLVNSGCSYRVSNTISEQKFEGTKTNLSEFAINLEQWNTVKIINQNKKLSLLVNNNFVFTGSYKESLGLLRGVFVEFEGNGFVKVCKLSTLSGKILYQF